MKWCVSGNRLALPVSTKVGATVSVASDFEAEEREKEGIMESATVAMKTLSVINVFAFYFMREFSMETLSSLILNWFST